VNNKRGFTLVELVCVIAIIALLVALLMPTLSLTRERSVRIICKNILRGYCLGGQAYLNDNDGAFPEPDEWLYTKGSDSESHPIGCRWHDRAMAPGGEIMSTHEEYRGKMWSYIYEGEDYSRPCPTFRRFAPLRGCENPTHNPELDIEPQYSYTMNGYLSTRRDGGVLNLSEVRNPGNVFFFAEENSWSVQPDHRQFPASWLSAPLSTKALDDTMLLIGPTPVAKDCFGTYHNAPSKDLNRGFGNVVFIDGHGESIRAEQQLRKIMHGISGRMGRGGRLGSHIGPAGNLHWAWASKSPPPSGWDGQ
jgi:prepilin-type N-terminal cleavage/methylation domain-containing protein